MTQKDSGWTEPASTCLLACYLFLIICRRYVAVVVCGVGGYRLCPEGAMASRDVGCPSFDWELLLLLLLIAVVEVVVDDGSCW